MSKCIIQVENCTDGDVLCVVTNLKTGKIQPPVLLDFRTRDGAIEDLKVDCHNPYKVAFYGDRGHKEIRIDKNSATVTLNDNGIVT